MKGLFSTPDSRLRTCAFMGLVLALAAGVLLQFAGAAAPGLQLSGTHGVLAVDRTLATAELDAFLAQNGFPDRVSEFNASAAVSSFGFTRMQGVKQFLSSVPSDDIRLTPWIKGVLRAFSDRDGRYSLWYLPLDAAALRGGDQAKVLLVSLDDLLRPAFGMEQGRDWFLLGQQTQGTGWAGLVFFCIALFAVLFFAPSGGVMILVTALLCLPRVFNAPFHELALMVGILFVWATLLELLLPAFRRFTHDDGQGVFPWDCLSVKKARRGAFSALALYCDMKALAYRGSAGLVFALILLVAGVFQGGFAGAMGVLLVLAACPVLLLGVYGFVLQSRRRHLEHRLFVPVPIMSRSNVFHTRMRKAVPWFMALWVAGAVVALAGMGSGASGAVPRGEFPVVQQAGPSDQSVAVSMERIWPHGTRIDPDKAGLPDLKDFLVNECWQDALPWLDREGRIGFAVPEFGTLMQIPEHVVSAGRVSTTAKQVAAFNEAWISGLASRSSKPGGRTSLEALLMAGDRASQLVYQRPGRIYSSPDWLLVSWGTTGAFFLLLWFRGRHATNRQWYDARSTFTQVRKQAV